MYVGFDKNLQKTMCCVLLCHLSLKYATNMNVRGLSGKFVDTVHTRANPSNNMKFRQNFNS